MRIILVEDNPQVRELLRAQLPVHWPGAVVVGEAESIAEGLDLLPRVPADIWLLDIELRDGNVFTLLDSLDPALVERTALVFLTAFGDQAFILEALQKSAVGYLLKPLDLGALRPVLEKAQVRLARRDLHGQLDDLRHLLQLNRVPVAPPVEKIPVFGIKRHVYYLAVADIGYLKGDGEVTSFCLIAPQEQPLTSVKNIGFYEDLLVERCGFFNLSKGILVNSRYIARYDPSEGLVELTDGTRVSVSRRGGQQLLEYFRSIFRTGG